MPLTKVKEFSRQGSAVLLAGCDIFAWPELNEFLIFSQEKKLFLELEVNLTQITTEKIKFFQENQIKKLYIRIFDLTTDFAVTLSQLRNARIDYQMLLIVNQKTLKQNSLSVIKKITALAKQQKVLIEFHLSHQGKNIKPALKLLQEIFINSQNTFFSGLRFASNGYLPPCSLKKLWQIRPDIWNMVFLPDGREKENTSLPACRSCAVRSYCQWQPSSEFSSSRGVSLEAPTALNLPWRQKRLPVVFSREVQKKILAKNILCTKPWTTLQISDLDGIVHQCCSTWTKGGRGNVFNNTLSEIWNNQEYQQARQWMLRSQQDRLCKNICPRVYDKKYSLENFQIMGGSEKFVQNQELLLEQMLSGSTKIDAKPLYMALCPGTYCNYDCVMCIHGRSPARNLPDFIWEELPGFLPTLNVLTLLGGEPLASRQVMNFLANTKRDDYPDLQIDLITNGSLLNSNNLRKLQHSNLRSLTISVNAGTAATYQKIMRGISFIDIKKNFDALIEHRSHANRWIDITINLVVQYDNCHDFIDFIKLARQYNFNIRLIPLSPESVPELDFYNDDQKRMTVLAELENLIVFLREEEPRWLGEAEAVYQAVKRKKSGATDINAQFTY